MLRKVRRIKLGPRIYRRLTEEGTRRSFSARIRGSQEQDDLA
jgi:hypothetical protein